MTHDIPADRPADDDRPAPHRPSIRTQADLEATWRRLMEPLGFSRHSLWLMLLDADGRPVPQLVEIDDAHRAPGEEDLDGFAHFVLDLVTDLVPGGRLAALRSRPGVGGPDADDLGWARVLVGACRRVGVATEVVHLATDVDLLPLPYDVLAVA